MARKKVQTTAVPIRAISHAEAERRRNPPPLPKVPVREVPKPEPSKRVGAGVYTAEWTAARQHALDILDLRHKGDTAKAVIDPRYKPTWISRQKPWGLDPRTGKPAPEEGFRKCNIVTPVAIGPGSAKYPLAGDKDKPGYVSMTVNVESCMFLQPAVERTRLTRQAGIGSLIAEEMVQAWAEEDRQYFAEGKFRERGAGAGRTLPTGQGIRFSSRGGAGGRRMDPVGADEAAQARPEYTVLARGVDSQFRPIVKVRIEGMPRVGAVRPDPRHGPVTVVKPADKPSTPKPKVPGLLVAEATNEIIISVAHAREHWSTLGRGGKRILQREGLSPKPEHEVLQDAVRAWWKDVGTR